VTSEAVAAGNRRWLTLPNFTEDYLLNAEENTLHTVTLQTVTLHAKMTQIG